MEEFRQPIILGFLTLYMLVTIGIGIWAMRKTKNANDFFMAGKNLGIMVTSFAVFSSTMSGFGFVGGPGLVYTMGMSSVWMVVCVLMGFNISFWALAKRLRLFAEFKDCVSLPDVIKLRYNSSTTQFLSAIAIIFGVLGYLATQILAMAVTLKELLLAGGYFPNASLEICLVISCSILLFYSVAGGMIASVYTDVMQGAIMIIGAFLVFIAVLDVYDEGFYAISSTIAADDLGAISPWGTLGMVGSLSWFLVFCIGGSAQPHVITKMMMTKRIEDAKYILPLSMVGYIFSALLWIGIGLVMRALVLDGLHPELSTPDAAASQFLQHYANPIIAGIVFASLFAAIMSTADSFLNIGTAALMHDIPKSLSVSVSNPLLVARIVTVILCLMASLIALYSGNLIALLGAFGWGTFAAALVPVVTIGLNWKRATAMAANAAIICSLSINLLVKAMAISMPFGLDVSALSMVVAISLFIGVSLLSKPETLSPEADLVMRQ